MLMRDGDTVNKYVFYFLVFISISFIILPLSNFAISTRLFFSYAINPHFSFFHKYEKRLSRIPENIKNLIESDIILREREEKNKRLQRELASLNSIKEENARLRTLLGLSKNYTARGIFASVVSRTPIGGHDGFFIDKGSDDGIREGFAVMGFDGVNFSIVGRVMEVYPSYSKVIAISNPEFSFMAYGGKDAAEGLVRGNGQKPLILDYISSKYELLIGDRIYTSENSITFPGGLPVGIVLDVFKSSSSMNFYQAAIKPYVDIEKIKEVYVEEYVSPISVKEKQ